MGLLISQLDVYSQVCVFVFPRLDILLSILHNTAKLLYVCSCGIFKLNSVYAVEFQCSMLCVCVCVCVYVCVYGWSVVFELTKLATRLAAL